MAAPFTVRPLQPAPLVQRMLGRDTPENFPVAITNLLATSPRIADVSPAQIEQLYRHHGVTPFPYAQYFKDLYRYYLQYCLMDHSLSDREVEELGQLKILLGLNDLTVKEIHEEAATKVFREASRKAFEDRRLDAQERAFLDKLEREIRLPEKLASQILTEEAKAMTQSFLSDAVSDRRLSPSEDEELAAILKNLGPGARYGQNTLQLLAVYRLCWRLENGGELPVVDAGIPLERGETCHCHYQATLTKARKTWDRDLEEYYEDLEPVDKGDVWITSKRLLFLGTSSKANISLGKIVRLKSYPDGMQVGKATGKDLYLINAELSDLPGVILKRLIGCVDSPRAVPTRAYGALSRTIRTKVAGVTHSNSDGTSRQAILGKCLSGESICLRREADNPYDANAVAVVRISGEQLGYLKKELAQEVAAKIDTGRSFTGEILNVTGGTLLKPTRGCNIALYG